MEKMVIYQVLTRLWGNGRFSGWTEGVFRYLKSLSVDYLWLTGIPRHASGESYVKGDPGSPYAITDWKDTNPYFAEESERRLSEFRSLVGRAHAEGLKVITDFIPNHVAASYKGPVPVLGWHDGDWTDTVKVDYGRPETIAAFVDILRFWADNGVDGFRCDMVELVPPEAMREIISSLRSYKSGLLFVAEVYDRVNYNRYIKDAGFDLLYDKSGVYDIERGILCSSRSAEELSWNWQSLGDLQPLMLNFLENHDEQRICSEAYCGNMGKTWAALAYSLLFNTASFMLYAGGEIGEKAAESSDGRTSIFNWITVDSYVKLNHYIRSGKGLDASEENALARYRELLSLSKKEAFSVGGNWDLCYCQNSSFDRRKLSVFARYDSKGECFVFLCNFGSCEVCCEVVLPDEFRAAVGKELPEKLRMSASAYDFTFCNI